MKSRPFRSIAVHGRLTARGALSRTAIRCEAAIPVSKLHFEDFTPGPIFKYGPRRITRDEIVAYAAEFDPQPFHLDADAARSTMLGGLAASGWHACCILMRMSADSFVLNSSSM